METILQKIIACAMFVSIFFFIITPTVDAAVIIRPPNNLGLVGYWSFDEGRGTQVSDMSGNGNDGALSGGLEWASGQSHKSLTFDGVNGYVGIQGGWLYPSQTISFWAKPLEGESWIDVAGRPISSLRWSNPDHDGFFFSFSDTHSNVGYTVYNNNYANQGGSHALGNDNGWRHFALRWTPTNVSLFVDGNLVKSDNKTNEFTNNTSDMDIGRYNYQDNNYFNGTIDEVRIYNRALSESEIQSLYTNTRSTVVGVTPVDRYNEGLVGHWTFDGKHTTATTVTDVAGGNDGTINGAVPTQGIIGQAMEFDGVNDSLNMGNPDELNFGTGDFSYCYWLKTTDTSGQPVGKGVWGYRAWGTYLTGGKVRFEMKLENPPGNNFTADTLVINDGVWHHVCGTYDRDAVLSVYTDGQLSNTIQMSASASYTISNGTSFQVGDGFPGRFEGSIDDLRVYDRILSENEILGIYSATKSSTVSSSPDSLVTSGLVGHWSFDESSISGSNATDVSGNQSTATIVGDTSSVAGKIGEALTFDGTGDYVVLPTISGARSISMWVYIVSGQSGWRYLLDARTGLSNGYFASLGIGGDWSTLFVNGTAQTVSWASIPQGQWVHLYVETNTSFTDNINLMSRYSNNENLAGMLDDVRIYNRGLTQEEITQLYSMGQ